MIKFRRSQKNDLPCELALNCENLEPRTMLSSVQLLAAGVTGDELMELRIDNVTVQTWRLNAGADQGNFQSFQYQTAESLTPDRIRVAFINDVFDPENGIDANLRLDAMLLDGVRYETEDASVFSTGTWRVEDGVTAGFRQSEFLHANGFFQFAATDTGSQVTIRAAGQTGQEQMRLLIDNNVVATWNNVGGNPNQQIFQTFQFRANQFVTADRIRVEFTNDLFDPSNNLDRNLTVQGMTLDGVEYRTDSPTVLSTGTWRSETQDVRPGFFNAQTLHSNGYFSFSNNTTNQNSQILVIASGSEGGEQMNLKINGQIVRSWVVDRGANSGTFQVYGYRADSSVTADQIQVEFVGDRFVPGIFDANLRVDRILVDGIEFQTESPNVFSNGTWIGDGLSFGFAQSEFLSSDGFFQFTTGGNSPGAVSLASNRLSVDESRGAINVDIRRQGGTDGTLVIDYATVPGTATAGQDYVKTSGSIVFLPGQSVATVNVPILDDSLYEGNETFSFTVDNLRGNGTLAAPRTATILINDTDAVIPSFTSFTSSQSLRLNGDAALDNGTLRLTRAVNSVRGSAYFAAPMPINATTSFQTEFGFRIDGGQGTSGADGFAFIIQNSAAGNAALSSSVGGSLGYTGIDRSVVIEFDTFQNPGEVSSNHVSVSINGSPTALITRNSAIDFNGGANLRAWIDYNGDAQTLAVYVSNSATKPTTPLMVANVDLQGVVGNQGFLGFTAATGGANNNHRILDWNFSFVPPIVVPPSPGTQLVNQVVSSGYVQPTSMEFSSDGRNMYVAQQAGQVFVVRDGQRLATPFIDISAQVNGTRDRGLMDIALHPDFENNPYVYLLFTYDPPEVYQNASHPLAGPDRNGNRAGRLIRVTADASTNYTTTLAGSEVILLGRNSVWSNFNAFVNSTSDFNAPPAGILPDGTNIQDFIATDSESHTVGAIEFGPDGALYVSIGDGTSYNRVDPRTVRVQDIDNLSGKILRIDPLTGQGLSDNPFFNGDADANRSKVYQLGLRNPFRMSFDSVTGRFYVGDVGWTRWEEINSAGPGANFGWPYFEGGNSTSIRTGGYQDLPAAQAFYGSGQTVVAPTLGLSHAATGINAVVAGAVYRGTAYPAQFQGNLFFNDLGQGIVSSVAFNPDGSVADVSTFTTGARYVVQIVQGVDGNLYYVDLDDGHIGRWVFV
ncbi:MAG TPA: sugar dehydrogenase [Planctomycetaceae bacterium]|nr:sugar dehydrogenase [Planctomycetaceae bacterium]